MSFGRNFNLKENKISIEISFFKDYIRKLLQKHLIELNQGKYFHMFKNMIIDSWKLIISEDEELLQYFDQINPCS